MSRNIIKAILLVMVFHLFGCAEPKPAEPVALKAVPGKELYCLAETMEEAEEIAKSYDITLVTFGDGVATFTTDRNPLEVVAYGQQKGLPAISVNTASKKPYSKK